MNSQAYVESKLGTSTHKNQFIMRKVKIERNKAVTGCIVLCVIVVLQQVRHDEVTMLMHTCNSVHR